MRPFSPLLPAASHNFDLICTRLEVSIFHKVQRHCLIKDIMLSIHYEVQLWLLFLARRNCKTTIHGKCSQPGGCSGYVTPKKVTRTSKVADPSGSRPQGRNPRGRSNEPYRSCFIKCTRPTWVFRNSLIWVTTLLLTFCVNL